MNQHVILRISDPWDLGEAISWCPLEGELLKLEPDAHGGRALVRLGKPVQYKNSEWSYIVASPRHEGTAIDALQRGESAICAFTGITEAQAASSRPLDTSGWRGGLAFLGELEPLRRTP
jgi:hypothetical protein